MDNKKMVTLAQLSGRHKDLSGSLLDHFLSEKAKDEQAPAKHQKYVITEGQQPSSDVLAQLLTLFVLSSTGIIVVNGDCTIQFMNDAASAALSSETRLSVSDKGLLQIEDKQQQASLREQVSVACLNRSSTYKPQPLQDSRQLENILRVSPLQLRSDDQQEPYAIICINKRDEPLFDQELVQALFTLSRAEIAVCHALAAGNSVREIAEARGTSKETVRCQLKSIYAKTGSNGQHSLVSLLLTTTAPPLFRSN